MTTPTTPTPTTAKPRHSDAKPGDCAMSIAIDAHGDVNIHHHCGAAPGTSEPPTPAPCCPPIGEGNTCLPPVAGRKHKRSPAQKLAARQARVRVPSVLAASTMHLVRRFLAGKAPSNDLEQRAFARLNRTPASHRSTLACAASRFEDLPGDQHQALFDTTLPADVEQALDPDALATAFGREIAARASRATFGDAAVPFTEVPGRIRVFEPPPESFFTQLRICAINELRTDDFIPRLPAGAYGPAEVAQDCNTVLVDGQPQVVCQVRTNDCVGGQVDGVCLRVPAITAGSGVLLRGVNFFSTDAQVQLTSRVLGTVHLIDGFVNGDLVTPVTETVDGQIRLVNDCRVSDHLSFTLPADLPPGLYDLQVVVPNITGIAAFGERLLSNSEVIEVVPPPTARFQISLETLLCRKETPPARFGSDEVGLRFLAIPLLADLSIGLPQVSNRRFGDVDSGDSRNLGQLMFDQRQSILAVALGVLGHEVDGEDAYENQVTAWTDVFIDLVKDQVEFAKDSLKKLGLEPKDLVKLGPTGIVVVVIAIAVLLAIDLVIALWLPADLIIDDPTGYTLLDLVERTGAAFPMPPPSAFRTQSDIDVKVKPLDKLPNQYRELREYESDDEESRYEITYRFNQVA